MLVAWLAAVAHAGPDEDIARGWYLWRTGQDDAAAELAARLVDEHPAHLGAHRLHVAMEVVVGRGASVEARYREWWGLDPQDPARRVALAFAVAQRHPEAGPWCDEVAALLAGVPVTVPPAEGERPSKTRPFTIEHYWATVADRARELRCQGATDHAEAELRRLAKDGGVAWADGVVARLASGYVKEDLPPDLERLWTEHPERLDSAALLWRDDVSGPMAGRARSIASKALSDALAGDDPVAVHAALLAYRQMGKDGKLADAVARLEALDPQADPGLARSLDDVEDPPIYGAIDACGAAGRPDDILACLDAIEGVGANGAIRAHWSASRRAALEVAGRNDEAFDAARDAWRADPPHRFNARTFAKLAVAREALSPADAPLAVEAVEAVLAGRVTEGGDVPESQRRRLAADLELAALVRLAAGASGEAIEGQRLAAELDRSPRRRIVLGRVLAAAGQGDEAVLHLSHGLAAEVDDTALIASGRALLAELDQGWHPRGMAGLVDEAARTPDAPAPSHPLVGQAFPLPHLLPDLPAGEQPEPLAATAFVLWASWHAGDLGALRRAAAVSERYAEKNVAVRAASVGVEGDEVPEDISLESEHVGASAMRALRTVALPAVVVVDGEGRIASVLAPWDRDGQGLEVVLDELLPEEP